MFVAIPVVVLIVAPLLSSAINTHGQFVPMSGPPTNIGGNRWYTKSGPSLSYVNKRNTPSVVRQGKAYEDDVIEGEKPETVDLHKGEFCVDVSTFGPVTYDSTFVEVCDSTFAKQCEDRYESVITYRNKISSMSSSRVLSLAPLWGQMLISGRTA